MATILGKQAVGVYSVLAEMVAHILDEDELTGNNRLPTPRRYAKTLLLGEWTRTLEGRKPHSLHDIHGAFSIAVPQVER